MTEGHVKTGKDNRNGAKQARLLTPEIKAMLGQETVLIGKEPIDKSSIRRYAQAILDLNPIYFDEDYAKNSKHGAIIAPPTYIFDVSHDIFADTGKDGRDLTRITIDGLQAIRGGNEYQFKKPAKVGDVINAKRKIIDIYEKEGKTAGSILFIVYDITYTNQKDEVLGISRETMMFIK